MPSIPYDPTKQALLSPGDRPSLFLEPERLDRSSLPAVCAECSRLAYVEFEASTSERDRLAQALAAADISGLKTFDDTATDTQAFGAICKNGDVLVAFRGTEPKKLLDLKADVWATTRGWQFGGRVHVGFLNCFLAVESALDAFIQAHLGTGRLVVTGHSLGAALATLSASRWRGAKLVTFGSPRVGDVDFVATVSDVDVQRFVNCCDAVTTVPPELLAGYTHCGDLCYIDEAGLLQPSVTQPPSFGARTKLELQFFVRHALKPANVKVRSLADHAPINYIRAFT